MFIVTPLPSGPAPAGRNVVPESWTKLMGDPPNLLSRWGRNHLGPSSYKHAVPLGRTLAVPIPPAVLKT